MVSGTRMVCTVKFIAFEARKVLWHETATFNVDDLESIAADYLNLRQEEVARCEKIIAEKVAALMEANKFAATGDLR